MAADRNMSCLNGNATIAILSVPSLATGRSWLEKQMALLRAHSANIPVVIIMDDDEEARRPGLLASLSVQGYIPTSSNLDVALAALRLVIAGGCYFPHPAGDSAAAVSARQRPARNARRGKRCPSPFRLLVLVLIEIDVDDHANPPPVRGVRGLMSRSGRRRAAGAIAMPRARLDPN